MLFSTAWVIAFVTLTQFGKNGIVVVLVILLTFA